MKTDNWIHLQKYFAHKKQRSSDWTDLPEFLFRRIERLLVDHLARIVPESVAVVDAQSWRSCGREEVFSIRGPLEHRCVRHVDLQFVISTNVSNMPYSFTVEKAVRWISLTGLLYSSFIHPFAKFIHCYVIKAYDIEFDRPYALLKWSAHIVVLVVEPTWPYPSLNLALPYTSLA